MEEKDFEAKLRSVNEVKFPLVKAAFKGKDGNVYIGMMLIDTGSVDCILNKSVLSLIDSSLIREDDKKVIHSIQSDANTCQGVDFTFKMGNEVFSDIFYVNEEIDFNQKFEGFIGIIGHEFLRKHQLVLDYSSKTLHGSYGNLGNPSDYDFFFPMEYGIKQYNIPVVGLVYGTKEYIMVADSGANDTVITQFVIDESGASANAESGNGSVVGFNNKPMDTSIQEVNLCLLSIGGTEQEPKLCSYKDNVQVVGEHKYLMDNLKNSDGNELPPISGLLSSAFMLEHKWVLDFGAGVMYSNNVEHKDSIANNGLNQEKSLGL